MTVDLPESQVLKIWRDCAGRNDLETEEDGPVNVIYPGRINDGRGADFRDAVIQTGRGILTGDIEIHSKTSDWRAHRHHLDPLYNRVVLHIVFRHDMTKSVVLENGQTVPTLTLRKTVATGDKVYLLPDSSAPCRISKTSRDTGIFSGILDMAGEQRFQSRAAGFQVMSSPEEAGQALYRGIMVALGYSKNKHPMAELACRMPLAQLESLIMVEMPDMECLAIFQTMLLGTAGLLPSQRSSTVKMKNDSRLDRLEMLWSAADKPVTMSEKDWQFFRVRPGNFPARRIAAMSWLLVRFRKDGLLNGLTNILDKAAVDGNSWELEEALIVGSADPYMSGEQNPASLLGRDRAADIVINVLLPFAAAWGLVNLRPALAEKITGLYRGYPPPATNTLERHMSRQLGIDGSLVNTARRQQGLIHIFKNYCSLGACFSCPLYLSV
jgi:hypothetical protein